MLLSNIPSGTFGRWCFGLIILTHLIAYNESGSLCVLVAAGFAMLSSLLMVYSKNGLNQIQIPYLRASQRLDFICLFMALWMELLVLVATDAAIIRTISYCLDAMSGGLIRIYILGRNSSLSEPWPDVCGVVVVFIVSFMFIMGLENSKIFTILMITGVLSISALIAVITYVRGSTDSWNHEGLFPHDMSGILSASALLIMSFPNSLPTGERHPKIKAALLSFAILLSILLIAGCLSTLITISKSSHDYETVPILRILEIKNLHKLIPAISCLYIISCSGILLELFPQTFNIIVRLATSEWKILLKQIGYENRETGNPSLAIFLSGSLIAILTFACPLQNLTFIIAGAQLCHGILVAIFFLYSPHRPKVTETKHSTLAYSRLDTGTSKTPKSTAPKRSATWFLNKAVPSLSSQSLSKSINKLNKKHSKKEEREWLLLAEPSSPVVRNAQYDEECNAESSILSDTTTSDIDCIMKAEQLDTETSEEEEDIDSIVEEFQQKIKISTTGLKDTVLKLPTINSWRFSILCIAIIFTTCICGCYGATNENLIYIIISSIAILIISFIMIWIPKYSSSHATPSSFTCIIFIYTSSVLLSSIMFDSWLAIIFWFISGIILSLQSLIKCDIFCCLCLDYPHSSAQTTIVMEEHIIPNGSSNSLAATSIRIKNPPKGLSVVNHVQKYR
ncbi:probable cationic amino acid transporter isoform X2 [Chironomus tepperi]|uniref:probable cationic amino acid transporter isoform X2 n=1 Tax=Chironomus tepperi TaxID=113505 RepID=UPI00391FB46D